MNLRARDLNFGTARASGELKIRGSQRVGRDSETQTVDMAGKNRSAAMYAGS